MYEIRNYFPLEIIFHSNKHSLIFAKWLLISKEHIFTLSTTVKWEVSPTRSLQFDDKPCYKLFIWINNNRDLKIDSWETPELLPFQGEFLPFNSILCCRYFKRFLKTFKRFPGIYLRPDFRISLSCQALSKFFDTFKNAPLTSPCFIIIKRLVYFVNSHCVGKVICWMITSHFH